MLQLTTGQRLGPKPMEIKLRNCKIISSSSLHRQETVLRISILRMMATKLSNISNKETFGLQLEGLGREGWHKQIRTTLVFTSNSRFKHRTVLPWPCLLMATHTTVCHNSHKLLSMPLSMSLMQLANLSTSTSIEKTKPLESKALVEGI